MEPTTPELLVQHHSIRHKREEIKREREEIKREREREREREIGVGQRGSEREKIRERVGVCV